MKKFLPVLFAVLLLYCVSLVSPLITNAQLSTAAAANCNPDEVQTDFGCFPNDPIGFVQKFYSYGIGLIGGLSLLMLIWGGYTILTSRGEARQVNVGKSYIFYAIIGLLLAIFGYVFFQLIAVDVLHLPGFSK